MAYNRSYNRSNLFNGRTQQGGNQTRGGTHGRGMNNGGNGDLMWSIEKSNKGCQEQSDCPFGHCRGGYCWGYKGTT